MTLASAQVSAKGAPGGNQLEPGYPSGLQGKATLGRQLVHRTEHVAATAPYQHTQHQKKFSSWLVKHYHALRAGAGTISQLCNQVSAEALNTAGVCEHRTCPTILHVVERTLQQKGKGKRQRQALARAGQPVGGVRTMAVIGQLNEKKNTA